jgi:outer membrane protein assembly factor BamB
MTARLSIVFCLGLMLFAGTACAADWGQWRGPAQTGHVPAGVPVPTALAAELKPVWRAKMGEGLSSPVVAGGKVFYLDRDAAKETACAADAATGKELWRVPLHELFRDGFGTGPRAAALVDGDCVYVQSCKGEFQCLNAADGKVIWRKNFVQDFGAVFTGEVGKSVGASRHGNTGSAVVDGDNVIVQAGGANGASVVCLNKKTGEVVWKSQNDPAGYAAAVLATIHGVKQAVVFTADGCIGVDTKDGKLLWRVPVKTGFGRHVTTPVIVDNLVVVSSHTAGLICSRIVKDEKEPSGFKAENAWTQKPLATNFASPVAVGKHLFTIGPAKNVICVDLETGQAAWDKKGLIVSPDPGKAYAGFLVMDKNVLMLSDTGQLILFAADPKEYKEVGRAQICGKTWCIPAYADGKLYLRDAQEMLCFELVK